MARIKMGNRDGAVALRQARSVLTELTAEWPDVQVAQRTVKGDGADALVRALENEEIGIAVQALDTLPAPLPDGMALAAVARRLEPRSALVAKGVGSLEAVPEGAVVGVSGPRDRTFLNTVRPDLHAEELTDPLDEALSRVANEELRAMVVPAYCLHVLDQRQRIGALLEAEHFAPAPGQGALGLVVREDDDLAFELAYTLQHRPSFDRVRAERAFQQELAGHVVGALASVTDDGEMTLFGVIADGRTSLQASVTGEASEAEQLGRELAQDVQEQLAAI